MKKDIYIRNVQSQGNKRVSYEISNDCTHWVETEDFRVELLNSIGSGDLLKIVPLNNKEKELWIRHIRSMKYECAQAGTTDFRVNKEKRSFWINGKAYYICDDLQGLGANELASIGRSVMVFDISMDCGEKWISGICKEDNPLIVIPSDNKTTDNKDNIKQSSQDHKLGLNDIFNYEESFKKHALSMMMLRPGVEFLYYEPEDATLLWMFKNGEIFCETYNRIIGASAFVWIMKHYDQKEDFCYLLDVLDEQIANKWSKVFEEPDRLIKEIKKYIPSFKLGNAPQRVSIAVGYAWLDLQAILQFVDFCDKNITTIPLKNKQRIQECSTNEDLADLFLTEMHITRNAAGNRFEDEELPF